MLALARIVCYNIIKKREAGASQRKKGEIIMRTIDKEYVLEMKDTAGTK